MGSDAPASDSAPPKSRHLASRVETLRRPLERVEQGAARQLARADVPVPPHGDRDQTLARVDIPPRFSLVLRHSLGCARGSVSRPTRTNRSPGLHGTERDGKEYVAQGLGAAEEISPGGRVLAQCTSQDRLLGKATSLSGNSPGAPVRTSEREEERRGVHCRSRALRLMGSFRTVVGIADGSFGAGGGDSQTGRFE